MVTSNDADSKDDSSVDDVKEDIEDQGGAANADSTLKIKIMNGRPDLASLVRSRSQESPGRLAVSCKSLIPCRSPQCSCKYSVRPRIIHE